MLKTPLSLFLGALIVLITVYVVDAYFQVRSMPAYDSAIFEVDDDPVAKAANSRPANDSLPHYRYQQISDSLERASMEQDPYQTGEGVSFLGLWVYRPIDKNRAERFIGLRDCRLALNTEFTMYQGAAHLLYIQWDTARNRMKTSDWRGWYKSKPIQVGFKEKEGMLLIPVGQTTYTVLKVVAWLMMFVGLFICLTVFIRYPYRILSSIARGDAFHEDNPVYFKRMSIVVVIFAALVVIIPLIVSLVFNRVIPAEIDLQIAQRFTSQIPTVILATSLWLLGEAFSRGSRLQEFEETTV